MKGEHKSRTRLKTRKGYHVLAGIRLNLGKMVRARKLDAELMSDEAWELTQSVETDASLAFAWNYWTNVANWDDPPAKFELDGPFAAGSHGTTRLPGQERLHWLLRRSLLPIRPSSICNWTEQCCLSNGDLTR